MKKFEFSDYSDSDYEGWWDERYICDDIGTVGSLAEILDKCLSTEDKKALNKNPKHKYVIADDEWEYVFSEFEYFNIRECRKDIESLGYNITIDGLSVFDYVFGLSGYVKDVNGKLNNIPELANKYIANTEFMSKLKELLNVCGVECGDTYSHAMESFLNLIEINNKAKDIAKLLAPQSEQEYTKHTNNSRG